jgi:hypothetical protein
MVLWDAQKRDGVSQAERVACMEKTLRVAWPQAREWKYLCKTCFDTGLIVKVCQPGDRCDGVSMRLDTRHDHPGKYARLCQNDPDGVVIHDYGVPCFCSRGERFKDRPKGGDEGDGFTQATRGKGGRR